MDDITYLSATVVDESKSQDVKDSLDFVEFSAILRVSL